MKSLLYRPFQQMLNQLQAANAFFRNKKMIDPASELKKLLEAHEVPCIVQNEWVIPNNKLPAIRALWHPGKSNGRLDIHVLLEDGIIIEECFAGIGSDSDGFHDALHNFMVNSLHVFLAAFWGQDDPEQVTTETWKIGDRQFMAYIGNLGMRASDGVHFTVPSELFESIATTVKNEKLSRDVHWVRAFFCNLSGNQTFEALLDNEEWPAGLNCLKTVPWEKTNGYYSVRNFLLLRAL